MNTTSIESQITTLQLAVKFSQYFVNDSTMSPKRLELFLEKFSTLLSIRYNTSPDEATLKSLQFFQRLYQDAQRYSVYIKDQKIWNTFDELILADKALRNLVVEFLNTA